MPTYEYHCDSCSRNFDVVQSFQDDALTACPTCGSPVRKVFGSVGIVFKGSGFYKTDSRDNGAEKTGAGEHSGASEAGGGDSSTGAGDGAGSGAGTPTTPASGDGSSSGTDKPATPTAPSKPAAPSPSHRTDKASSGAERAAAP